MMTGSWGYLGLFANIVGLNKQTNALPCLSRVAVFYPGDSGRSHTGFDSRFKPGYYIDPLSGKERAVYCQFPLSGGLSHTIWKGIITVIRFPLPD